MVNVMEDALYDRYYTGLGVVRGIWNTKRITNQYRTGMPRYEYVSSQDIFIDPNTRQKDKSDMRYMFHVIRYDTDELKRQYPKYANMIQSAVDEKRIAATDTTRVIILQYKRYITLEKIFVQDEDAGISQSFPVQEWYDLINQISSDPYTMALYNENADDMEYADWLMKGLWLPEKVSVSSIIEVEEPAVFQAIFLQDAGIVLEYPQYIGQEYSYFFLIGYHDSDSAYPFGLAHYMKDLQEISVILMTVLTIQAVKMYKAEKMIQSGALLNEKEYKERGYELGVNPIVDSDWQKGHPGQKAVEYLDLPQFPAAILTLNEQLVHAQKTMTGAVDSAIGIAQYSGQSGVQVAQLQMASRIYQKEEIEGFRRFIGSACIWLKDMIALYRNYPHKIKGIDQDNRIGLVDVATDIKNRLDASLYIVEVYIQESYEVVKQVERELYMNLKNDRLISPLEYMRKLDIANADKKLDEAQQFYGDYEYLQLIKNNPVIKEVIQQYMASQGGNDEQIKSSV